MKAVFALIGWIALALMAGGVGSLATRRAPEFYAQLTRPEWAPPASVFGPVWTTLFILMGIAAWLVWRERDAKPVRTALTLFSVQLIVNALWSWLFFAWRLGTVSLIEIVVLLTLIVATSIAFWKVRPMAALLLLPYIAWVSYATALTAALVRRNPHLLGAITALVIIP